MMQGRHLKQFCRLETDCEQILEKAVDILGFSARACHSILRTARTIADLDDTVTIKRRHMAEAIQLRNYR
jgi:magnesium chelatase family protein